MNINPSNTPITSEEKTKRNKQRYLTLIEKCRNHEYLTMEERKTQGISPEEKQAASAALRKISRANYRIRNREAINAYMNNLMKEKYKNDEVYRAKEIERGKLRYRKLVEQRRLDVLAKEPQQSLALTENRED
jgi:TRAP-type C4-dicarboxylate transport system substrate-binding protein